MKELNIKNYQAWVLEAFDLDKVVVDCGEELGDTWNWEGRGEFESLEYGPELLSLLDIYFPDPSGLLLLPPSCVYTEEVISNPDKVATIQNPYGQPDYDWKWRILKFIPENIPELQKATEEYIEQDARVDLKTWLEQESKN